MQSTVLASALGHEFGRCALGKPHEEVAAVLVSLLRALHFDPALAGFIGRVLRLCHDAFAATLSAFRKQRFAVPKRLADLKAISC